MTEAAREMYGETFAEWLSRVNADQPTPPATQPRTPAGSTEEATS